jgi:hypothetical protein
MANCEEVVMSHTRSYEYLDEENFGDDFTDISDNAEVLDDIENAAIQKASKRKNARKSVEEYLEHKRLKRQYHDLFDDDCLDDN